MTDYRKEAEIIKEDIVHDRRIIHGYAETAFDLSKTTAYVKDRLTSFGVVPKDCGKAGVTAVVGSGSPCIMLRADMDALPMKEESGLDFASTGGSCHSCGHDMHTAMLLGAAKLLKDHESELKGSVKFMFQPAEEILGGAADMIASGLLNDPKVDAAIGMHVGAGNGAKSATGLVGYKKAYQTFSGDFVKVIIEGIQAHGSMPEKGVDAINIAAHIVTALHELSAHEVTNTERSVVLVGKIYGGSSCNTESGECTLEISVRAESREMRAFLKKRVKEISEGIATTFRGRAIVEYVYGMPPLYNDPTMTDAVSGYARELLGDDGVYEYSEISGTEDFSVVSENVPSSYLFIGAGNIAGEGITVHNPKIIFDEGVLPVGSALYAYTAARWLEDN